MRNLRFTWDTGGAVVVRATPPDDVLADYLSEELQPGGWLAAWRLLEVVQGVRAGRHGGWEEPGESWSVELTPARATLRTEHAIPGRTWHLPLEDFEEALRAWLDFVQSRRAPAS